MQYLHTSSQNSAQDQTLTGWKALAIFAIQNTTSMTDARSNNVLFSEVSIRSYDLCIGDSPCVLVGAAISLDWTYRESSPVSVNEFEFFRAPRRRQTDELRMSAQDRHRKLVSDFGFSATEIRQAVTRTVLHRGGKRPSNSKIHISPPVSVSGHAPCIIRCGSRVPRLRIPRYPKSHSDKSPVAQGTGGMSLLPETL